MKKGGIFLTYKGRLVLLMMMDSIIVFVSIFLSYWIVYTSTTIQSAPALFISSVTLLVCHHIFASIYRLYNKAWEYASVDEMLAIFKAVTLSVLVTAIMQKVLVDMIYLRVLVITWMFHMTLIGGSRFVWRILRSQYFSSDDVEKKRTLIIGAGSAGMMIAKQLLKNPDSELKPVAFIDDNVTKQKLEFCGLPVAGGTSDIERVVKRYKIENIVIAIPSMSKTEQRQILESCLQTKATTKILPRIEDIITGKVSVNQFREVNVEDLLGREPIELDMDSISKKLTGKVVLVTGAGGSIGSEICRQVCTFDPKAILLLGHGENSIYQIDMELRRKYKDTMTIIPIIADIQDRGRIFEVMDKYRPDVVYHAAAHKHVPLMEYNPMEAVKNNVYGTKNVAEAASTFAVKNFVLISSDKAVNPPNVMGATKRVAEMIIQSLSKTSPTNFVAVRFGNVLGSRGSVIPLFKKQIQAGGPVTVTHPDMTRYFMTIPEAARLVMQAGALARGGEIFVLDMGESVKIVDLAKNLIRLSGYSVDEIGIEYTGIRPGEKMYEELLNKNEVHPKQIFPKIHIGKAAEIDHAYLWNFINQLPNYEEYEVKEHLIRIANVKESNDLEEIPSK